MLHALLEMDNAISPIALIARTTMAAEAMVMIPSAVLIATTLEFASMPKKARNPPGRIIGVKTTLASHRERV